MSRPRRQRRREQGHPKRIAERREHRQSKDRERSPIAGMCKVAAGLDGAYAAELYASELLGMPWRERGFEDPDEFEADLGGELISDIAGHGGPGAAVLLAAVAALAGPTLARKAAALAKTLPTDTRRPAWIDAIGTSRPQQTAVMSDSTFDDGRTYFIESMNGRGERDVVGVYIDHNIGCSAKDILIAPSIAEIREIYEANPMPGAVPSFEEINPALAAARIRAAVELTDQTLDPVVSEEYSSYRALARNRTATLPEAQPDDGAPEVSEAEQEALLTEFLASPEAAGIKPESDAADVVSSAIGFASGYVDGRPLRWSPVTVELFLADWLPRKVIAEVEYFAAAPDALTAWVRFASRKRELSTEALDQVLAAIPVYARELEAALAEPPGGGGPAKELFTALKEAGIDPSDEEALQTFIAGWNARSTLD